MDAIPPLRGSVLPAILQNNARTSSGTVCNERAACELWMAARRGVAFRARDKFIESIPETRAWTGALNSRRSWLKWENRGMNPTELVRHSVRENLSAVEL